MNANEIAKLMKQFEHSNLNEFRIARGTSSVYFSKLTRPGAVANANSAPVTVPSRSVAPAHQPVVKPTKVHHPAGSTSSQSVAPAGQTIKAPLVGIVYFAPSSKQPAFVKMGSHVKKGDVVCQIEAMKVLNDVKAPVSGTVEKRLVKNGAMVQYHQPIFVVKED